MDVEQWIVRMGGGWNWLPTLPLNHAVFNLWLSDKFQNPVCIVDPMGKIWAGIWSEEWALFQAIPSLNEASLSANSSYMIVISHIYDVLFCLTYCYLRDYTSMPFLSRPKEFALPTKTNRQLRKAARNKELSSVHRCSRWMGVGSEAGGSVQKIGVNMRISSITGLRWPVVSRKLSSKITWQWSRMVVRLSALRTGRFYLQEIVMVFISVRGWVDPKAIVRSEELRQCKIPNTLSGIEHVTFGFVSQHLDHWATTTGQHNEW